jgi:glycosyltransferase involved in cell wall biosynthesis
MPDRPSSMLILIPLYNDWDSAGLLLRELDAVFGRERLSPDVLLVDDASTTPIPASFCSVSLAAIRSLDILQLRRNLGHQRAIAVGLAFVQSSRPCDVVIVMDGDGEDKPSDIPRLLDRLNLEHRAKIVFAERTRRSENLVFRLFYRLYRILHKLLTGFSVRVGNFSILPYPALDTLVVVSELWNHYAAAVFKARIPYTTVPTERGTRLSGRPHMHFNSLVVHGLSALSVYGDVIGVRLLVVATALVLLLALGILLAIVIRFTTTLAIPGWATYTTGILLLILLQILIIAGLFVFTILSGRASLTFLPIRDHHFFVRRLIRLLPHES